MRTWTFTEENGTEHTITYDRHYGFNRKLTVDGEEHKVKSMSIWLEMVDAVIDFGKVECHLVSVGKDADLAVNGVFLDSGREYVPLENTPMWVHLLCVVSIFGGVLCGGLLGAAIGMIFSTLYVKHSMQKNTSMVAAFFVACCAVQFLAQVLVFRLLYC